jgi:hypothetical protein
VSDLLDIISKGNSRSAHEILCEEYCTTGHWASQRFIHRTKGMYNNEILNLFPNLVHETI